MSSGDHGRGRLAESLPEAPPPLVAMQGGLEGGGPTAGAGPSGRSTDRRESCPFGACDGSGWLIDAEDVATPCECRSRKVDRARARGVSATLPKRFRGVSFDRPPVTEMERDRRLRTKVGEIRSFCEEIDARLDAGRGIWLQGEPGTGKTTLAMLVSKSALDAGRTAAIYSLPGLLARIRRTFDGEPGEDSYFTFFHRLTSVDLLHLDDLGAENRTEWVLEQLYSIIDRRYSDQRSIVVTTNHDENTLIEQLGQRIVSRLTEICGDPTVIEGEDKRMQYAPPGSGEAI